MANLLLKTIVFNRFQSLVTSWKCVGFLSVYCNLEYREMVVEVLLLYSNGNMLKNPNFDQKKFNCVSWYLD